MMVLSNKKNWISFILIISILLLCITIHNVADAEDNAVNLILSENIVSSLPLFNGSDPFLAPGAAIKKKFNIQNKSIRNYCISRIKVTNLDLKDSNGSLVKDSSITDYFCDKVKCKIEKVGVINSQALNESIYEGKLENLVTQGGAVINDESLTVFKGSSRKFTIQIEMDNGADNRLQGLSCNIDIQFEAVSKDGSNLVYPDELVPSGSSGLIKTGTFLDTISLSIIGTLIVIIGIIIMKRKSKL